MLLALPYHFSFLWPLSFIAFIPYFFFLENSSGTLVAGTGVASDCWYQDYEINVVNGVITGTLFHQNRGQRMTSDVSGQVASDGAAALEMKREYPNRRSIAAGLFTKEAFKATDRGGGRCLYEVVLKRQ